VENKIDFMSLRQQKGITNSLQIRVGGKRTKQEGLRKDLVATNEIGIQAIVLLTPSHPQTKVSLKAEVVEFRTFGIVWGNPSAKSLHRVVGSQSGREIYGWTARDVGVAWGAVNGTAFSVFNPT